MAFDQLFNRLFKDEDKSQCYQWKADIEGLNYYVPEKLTRKIKQGDAGLWLTQQHVTLNMLIEEGLAEAIPNGFVVPSQTVVNLDKVTRDLLSLPEQWSGDIQTEIKSAAGKSNFVIDLKVNTGKRFTSAYQYEGPILKFSEEIQFLLTPYQYRIFHAIEQHHNSEKSEYDNYAVIYELQEAKKSGASINLSHFEQLNIKIPNTISIESEFDAQGNLITTPFVEQDASHEKMQSVLGQLRSNDTRALRVDKEIILFTEEKLQAVHEILKNRVIPKEKVASFLKNPTAFIDSTLVDLDIGFSVRVQGATAFKHAYFGETDESGINWFGEKGNIESILPISKISSYIKDEEDFGQFKQQLNDAEKTGAEEFTFNDKTYDISDRDAVTEAIDKVKRKLQDRIPDETSDDIEPEEETETIVVDVALNDERLDNTAKEIDETIKEILLPKKELDLSNIAFETVLPHQDIGIRWITGLATAAEPKSGALFADDMGLGKTFMSLAAAEQLYKIHTKEQKTLKPCLVIAPLSLLQTWSDEVEKAFKKSPFRDKIILQSDADLPKFRVGGVETKQVIDENAHAEIQYSLKVGKDFYDERLDLDKRLVITTYDVLRDYQFSLCRIDWGLIIFDEAQNIKNPNALKSRAAKGLKADFKLVATGTPVENSLSDFWCLFDTACPGYIGSYQEFRQNYISPIRQAAGDEVDEVRAQTGRALRTKVGALMLRREKEDSLVGLPKKQIFVGMDSSDWTYDDTLMSIMKSQQLDRYDAAINTHDTSDNNQVFATLFRLRDVSLHPQLADGGQLLAVKPKKALKTLMLESGKMSSLLKTLDKIQKKQEKCIIFMVNKRLQSFLSIALGQLYNLGPLSIINGDAKAVAKKASVPTRKSMIVDFESKKGFNLIIMSPVAAGVGLTVVGANNVIHYERHWNPAKEAQATDRVYRIGQTKDVNVFIPILHHPSGEIESFDVNLHRLLSKKTQLKDAVVTPEQVIPFPSGIDTNQHPSTHQITIKDVHSLSWKHFEALCAELFSKEFDVDSCWLTNDGPDFGADIALIKGNNGWLIQCKHTKAAKYQRYMEVLEVFTSQKRYSNAQNKNYDQLLFATNAKSISAKAKELAIEHSIEIYTLKEISELVEKHKITYEDILNRLNKKRLKID
ncbi:MAG: DEAD/DEAH box helicase family protein [Methylococcales bacterium]|jgi:SNF2 family DNA or RNA helicase|nr:DEAD/DEAH box helicase family protein [Methylococcales bacterium]